MKAEYKGKSIRKTLAGYWVGLECFSSLLDATDAIDAGTYRKYIRR